MPYSCCKCTTQCCCVDYHCSCPVERNGEVPCILNFFGLTLCYEGACNVSLCATVGGLKSKFSDNNLDKSKLKSNIELSSSTTDDKIHADQATSNEATSVEKVVSKQEHRVAGRTEVKDLYPCIGACCMIASIFSKFPDVFGWYCSCILCCCKDESLGNKPAIEKGEIFQGDIYILCEDRCVLIYPSSCCNCVDQCFCIDFRCAFPCDPVNGVPCLVNICFINCCYNWTLKPGQTCFKPLGYTMGEMA